MGTLLGILAIIFCCIVIWKASDGFEVASEYIGRNLNDGVRGATINAIGSSMPELFTTFFFFFYYAFFKESLSEASDGFAGGIGTTAGSAIFNGMIIPAVVILAVIGYGLARSVTVSKKVILRDGLSLIVAEFFLILLISGTTLYWWHGLLLMAIYGIYITIMLKTMSAKIHSDEEETETFYENDSDRPLWYQLITINLAPIFIAGSINKKNAWFLLIASMLVIGLACFLLVLSCDQIALDMGVEPYFVAVILASAATSVPDTILSYRDALGGEYDDAVANALGSNIFDICFALGFPLFVFTLLYGPVQMSPSTIENVTELRVLLLSLTIIAFLIYFVGRGMGRFKAFLLLLIYILFSFYIYAKATDQEWAIQLGGFLRSFLN